MRSIAQFPCSCARWESLAAPRLTNRGLPDFSACASPRIAVGNLEDPHRGAKIALNHANYARSRTAEIAGYAVPAAPRASRFFGLRQSAHCGGKSRKFALGREKTALNHANYARSRTAETAGYAVPAAPRLPDFPPCARPRIAAGSLENSHWSAKNGKFQRIILGNRHKTAPNRAKSAQQQANDREKPENPALTPAKSPQSGAKRPRSSRRAADRRRRPPDYRTC